MGCVNRLWNLCEDFQESIAVSVVNITGGGNHALVGTGKHMGVKEILARHAGERWHPCVGVASEWAIVG